MHLLLRCALALAQGDVLVEQAFSQLICLLAPQLLHMSTKLMGQGLILAVDSVPWIEYKFDGFREDMPTNDGVDAAHVQHSIMHSVHAWNWHMLVMVHRSPRGTLLPRKMTRDSAVGKLL